MGRTTLIAVLGAVVVGSTGGGLAALHFTSPRPRPAQVATQPTPVAGSGSAVISNATAPADTAASEPTTRAHASLTTQLTAVLTRFATWSRDHAGAPCPDLAALGLAAHDPWGHDFALTCTDQPADQIIGVVSPGPDGVIGTDDDVPSWTLSPSVTGLVRGPRWKSAATALPALRVLRSPSAQPLVTRRSRTTTPPPPPRSPTPNSTREGNHTNPPSGSASPLPSLPPPDPSGDDIPARRSSR